MWDILIIYIITWNQEYHVWESNIVSAILRNCYVVIFQSILFITFSKTISLVWNNILLLIKYFIYFLIITIIDEDEKSRCFWCLSLIEYKIFYYICDWLKKYLVKESAKRESDSHPGGSISIYMGSKHNL